MHISKVKTAIKVGDFYLRKDGTPNKINIKYCADEKILNDNSPRIYLIVENGIIKKIGGSSSVGGIKSTMSFYVNAMQGSPGVPRFVIHLLIADSLEKGNKVELYMITSPRVKAKVNGLFETHEVEIASFKEMENLCKLDYFNVEKKYPDWNFQENGQPYPPELARMHVEYHQRRLKGR